jgi:hypothetical protein
MPRKLLSIDGGGVRGVVALEVLARVEQLLRDETGDPSARGSGGFPDDLGRCNTPDRQGKAEIPRQTLTISG